MPVTGVRLASQSILGLYQIRLIVPSGGGASTVARRRHFRCFKPSWRHHVGSVANQINRFTIDYLPVNLAAGRIIPPPPSFSSPHLFISSRQPAIFPRRSQGVLERRLHTSSKSLKQW